MTDSVYQRVLGPAVDLLAPDLRAYFVGTPGVGAGTGVFEVAGSRRRILRPVLAYLAWRRILFPEYARDVQFEIRNTPLADGGLDAQTMCCAAWSVHTWGVTPSFISLAMLQAASLAGGMMMSERPWM